MKTKLCFIASVALLIIFQNTSGSAFLTKKISETTTIQLSPFSKIETNGGFEIELVQGSEESITIEASKSDLEYLKTDVKNGKLSVWVDKTLQLNKFKLTIRFKNIEEIVVNGGVSLKSKNDIRCDYLKIKVFGGAEIKLPVFSQTIDVALSGGTSADFNGKVTNSIFTLNGAGKIDAEKLVSDSVKIEIAGAGYAVVYASKSIDASISGVGSIQYTGNPAKVKSEIAGIGTIEEKGK